MSSDLYYDDSRLRQMFADLELKNRRKALRGAMQTAARKVRKVTVSLVKSEIQSKSKGLQRSVRAIVYKRKALGFRITVGEDRRRNKGYHRNRYGKEKPILRWADTGTASRKTYGRGRKPYSTGTLKQYGFISRTRSSVAGSVETDMKNALIESTKKIAQKYGSSFS